MNSKPGKFSLHVVLSGLAFGGAAVNSFFTLLHPPGPGGQPEQHQKRKVEVLESGWVADGARSPAGMNLARKKERGERWRLRFATGGPTKRVLDEAAANVSIRKSANLPNLCNW